MRMMGISISTSDTELSGLLSPIAVTKDSGENDEERDSTTKIRLGREFWTMDI